VSVFFEKLRMTLALKILIVEDNDDLREGWMSFFQGKGHFVRGVGLAAEILDESGDFTPDVYVVDLNLPDTDGLALVKKLRQVHPRVGIIITTARSMIGDKVIGYESGADIYFTKPVDPTELLAGIAAIAKKQWSLGVESEALHLRTDRNVLEGPNGLADLSPNETTLLAGLVRAAGQPLAPWQLAELLGFGDELPTAAALEMRIARLRKKLITAGAASPVIRAVYNRGYILCCKVLIG
jgi:DNA-binding response OmpR family regulator